MKQQLFPSFDRSTPQPLSRAARHTARRAVAHACGLEPMESRRLMSGDGGPGGPEFNGNYSVDGSVIYVFPNTGGHDETFQISADGTTFTLQSDLRGNITTPMAGKTDLVIWGGKGKETFWVNQTAGPVLRIDGGEGNDTFHLGNGDIDSNLHGAIEIFDNTTQNAGPQGTDTIVINDIFDTEGGTYTLGANSRFTKPGVQIDFVGAERLELLASGHADTINVNALAADKQLSLNGWGGADTFNVNSAVLDAAKQNVSISGASGADTLNIADASDTQNSNYSVHSAYIRKEGTPNRIAYTGIENVRLDAAAGAQDNQLLLYSGAAGTSYTVRAGAGNDSFAYGMGWVDSQMAGTSWNLQGQGGTDSLKYDDSFDTGDTDVYSIQSQSIVKEFGTQQAIAVQFTGMEGLDVRAGHGSTVINVLGLAQQTSIHAGFGDDEIRVFETYRQPGTGFPVPTVIDAGGGRDDVRLDPGSLGAVAHVRFNTSQDLNQLTMGRGALAMMGIDGNLVLDTQFFGSTGRLDLTNNSMVIRDWPVQSLDHIRTQVSNGYNGGAWYTTNGTSIYSTTSDDGIHAVGYGRASDIGMNSLGDAGSLNANDVVIRSTRYGDANLDRQVNFSDLLIQAQHYGQSSGANWSDGDFNFDGTVQFNDLLKLAQNYGNQLVQTANVVDDTAAVAKKRR